MVRYDDIDHRHFKKSQLHEYRNYYEIMRNCSQPLAPEQNHDADDRAQDQSLALFTYLVTIPGTYADTVLQAAGFALLAQLSQDHSLYALCDHHLPTSLPARKTHRSLCNATKLALSLCPLFPHGSEERATMRQLIHFLLQLLNAEGLRHQDVEYCCAMFAQGKWRQLWDMAMARARNMQVRKRKIPQSHVLAPPRRNRNTLTGAQRRAISPSLQDCVSRTNSCLQ